MIVGKRKVE